MNGNHFFCQLNHGVRCYRIIVCRIILRECWCLHLVLFRHFYCLICCWDGWLFLFFVRSQFCSGIFAFVFGASPSSSVSSGVALAAGLPGFVFPLSAASSAPADLPLRSVTMVAWHSGTCFEARFLVLPTRKAGQATNNPSRTRHVPEAVVRSLLSALAHVSPWVIELKMVLNTPSDPK